MLIIGRQDRRGHVPHCTRRCVIKPSQDFSGLELTRGDNGDNGMVITENGIEQLREAEAVEGEEPLDIQFEA
jgi:hypothetical protein